MPTCCVLGCKNPKEVTPANSFPIPRAQLETWTKLIGRPDIDEKSRKYYDRVCVDHFDRKAITYSQAHRLRLPPHTVPSFNLPAQETSVQKNIDEDMDILELENEIASFFTKSQVTRTKKHENPNPNPNPKAICKVKIECNSLLKERFLKLQENMLQKYDKHKFAQKYKLFCLNLYCSSPKAYKLFAKCLSLPSPKSLQNTKLILSNKYNESLINVLSKQLSKMPMKAKYVTVCLDEVPLAKHLYYDIRNDVIIGYTDLSRSKFLEVGENALILRIKGLLYDYEHMISYTVVGDTFGNSAVTGWLNKTIKQLFDRGFEVCAIVTQQTPKMNDFALVNGVTIENPCVVIDNKPIVFIFDIPQLFNSIRDNLLYNDLLYDDCKMASWQYVKSAYEKDLERQYKLAPKLTSAHIKPRGSQRTKVKLMKQAFSYTLAGAVSADVEAGHLPPEATGTAEFLLSMNNLYDLLDSTKMKSILNKYKNPFAGEEHQIEYITQAYERFRDIKMFDRLTGEERVHEVNCFIGILISLKAVLELQKYLNTLDIKSLFTRRLQLDSSAFISKLCRSKSKNKQPLTPIQLRRCFSKLVLINIMENANLVSGKFNLDSMIFVKQFEHNDFTPLEEYLPKPPKSSTLCIGTTDYRAQLPTVNTYDTYCSYFLYKCATIHKCETFTNYIRNRPKFITDPLVTRMFNSNLPIQKFVKPPREFFDYIYCCENWFIENFISANMLQKNVGARLYERLRSETDLQAPPDLCPCFPLDYLNKLFIRSRIYNILKFRNVNFQSSRKLQK